jgi:hypothetical protein
MLCEQRHLQLHIGEERRPGKQRMEFVIRLNVEEAVVRVFANDSVKSLPLPFPLQPLRVRPFSRAFRSSAYAAGMSLGKCTSILTRNSI